MEEKKKLIQLLATKYDLPLNEVHKIVNSQFKLVAKTMSEGNLESIRLPFFGLFKVNKNRVKYVTDAKRKSSSNKR
jgi:nucleoid DNA-binding protein